MSLEASILELAKAIASLAAALPQSVAAAPAAQAPAPTAEPEQSTVDKVVTRARRSKVTEAEIDKAAAETAAAALAKASSKEGEPAPAPAEAAPAPAPAAEAPAGDLTALRDSIRALIYKINDEKGRAEALGVLRVVGKNTLKEVDDADLPKVKAAAEKALAAEADIG